MNQRLQPVQVKYSGSPRRYTYLAPADWHVRTGDEVRMGLFSEWAEVVQIGPGTYTGPLKTLNLHRPACAPRPCCCRCQRGC